MVGKMTGANDFNSVHENKKPDRGADKIIAMDESVDQEFFEDKLRDFRIADAIDAFFSLDFSEIAHDKSKSPLKNLDHRSFKILAIKIAICDIITSKGYSFKATI